MCYNESPKSCQKGNDKMERNKNEVRRKQYIQLGLTIGYYRKLKGITQVELAKAVDLSRTHISNLEAPNMPTSISLDKLFEIADVLGVPVKSFFDFRD